MALSSLRQKWVCPDFMDFPGWGWVGRLCFTTLNSLPSFTSCLTACLMPLSAAQRSAACCSSFLFICWVWWWQNLSKGRSGFLLTSVPGEAQAGPCSTHPLHPHCWRQGSTGTPHTPASSLALLPWKPKFPALDSADAPKYHCTAQRWGQCSAACTWGSPLCHQKVKGWYHHPLVYLSTCFAHKVTPQNPSPGTIFKSHSNENTWLALLRVFISSKNRFLNIFQGWLKYEKQLYNQCLK